MRLRRYCRRIRNREMEHGDYELNLVPMLDMFLSLIPFLLLSAAFINYGGVFVEAPSFAAQEQVVVADAKSKELDLAVKVSRDDVKISAYSKGFLAKKDDLQGTFKLDDRANLQIYLQTLKKNYVIASVLFHVDPQIPYQQAVTVLQALRSSDLSKHIVLAVRNLP